MHKFISSKFYTVFLNETLGRRDVTFWYSTHGFNFVSATWTAARYQSSREYICDCRLLKVLDRFYAALRSRKRKSFYSIYISMRSSYSLAEFLAMDYEIVVSFSAGLRVQIDPGSHSVSYKSWIPWVFA
jgi:hypothetical protein